MPNRSSHLLATVLFGALAGLAFSVPRSAVAESKPAAEIAAATQAEGAPTSPDTITKDSALRLADQHLALRNTRWGKAIDIDDGGDEFIVSYETPENETRLVGRRSVSVRKSDGLVRIRPRR